MNIKDNSLSDDPSKEQLINALKSKKLDYPVIRDGLCTTLDAQLKFDKEQKGKPPIINKKISEK
jgi:hypothetical protein